MLTKEKCDELEKVCHLLKRILVINMQQDADRGYDNQHFSKLHQLYEYLRKEYASFYDEDVETTTEDKSVDYSMYFRIATVEHQTHLLLSSLQYVRSFGLNRIECIEIKYRLRSILQMFQNQYCPRPRGRGPLGKFWSYERGCWCNIYDDKKKVYCEIKDVTNDVNTSHVLDEKSNKNLIPEIGDECFQCNKRIKTNRNINVGIRLNDMNKFIDDGICNDLIQDNKITRNDSIYMDDNLCANDIDLIDSVCNDIAVFD